MGEKMKLSKMTKLIMSLLLLNSIVACKYQIEVTDLEGQDDETVFGQWEETPSSHIQITIARLSLLSQTKIQLPMEYLEKNGARARLSDEMECTESNGNVACSTQIIVETQNMANTMGTIKDKVFEIDVQDLVNDGIHQLIVFDENGASKRFSLAIPNYESEFIDSARVTQVTYNPNEQTITVNATHHLCIGKSQLALDIVDIDTGYPVHTTKPTTESHRSKSLVAPYIVKTGRVVLRQYINRDEMIACPAVVGEPSPISKVFTIEELDLSPGERLDLIDSLKKVHTVLIR